MSTEKKTVATPAPAANAIAHLIAIYEALSADDRNEFRAAIRAKEQEEALALKAAWQAQYANKRFIIVRGKMKGIEVTVLAQAAGGKRPLATCMTSNNVVLPHVAIEDLKVISAK